MFEVYLDKGVFEEKVRGLNAKIYLVPSHKTQFYAMILLRTGRGKFKRILLHRYILDVSREMIVDHVNRNTLDNRIKNLRVVTHSQNMQNRNLQKNNSTGIRGVTRRDSGKFCARVRLNRKVVYYEQFGTLEEAEAAVIVARQKYLPYSVEET